MLDGGRHAHLSYDSLDFDLARTPQICVTSYLPFLLDLTMEMGSLGKAQTEAFLDFDDSLLNLHCLCSTILTGIATDFLLDHSFLHRSGCSHSYYP